MTDAFIVEKTRKLYECERGWYEMWVEEDLLNNIDGIDCGGILDMNDPDEEFYPGEVYRKINFPKAPKAWRTK